MTQALLRRGLQGSSASEIRRLIRLAMKQGWRVVHRGHILLLHPQGGPPIVVPVTSGSTRSAAALRSRLRRRGVKVD